MNGYFLALLCCEGVLIPEVVPLPPYKEESIRGWQLRWLLNGEGLQGGAPRSNRLERGEFGTSHSFGRPGSS